MRYRISISHGPIAFDRISKLCGHICDNVYRGVNTLGRVYRGVNTLGRVYRGVNTLGRVYRV